MYLDIISLRRGGSEERVETVPSSLKLNFKLQTKQACKAHIIIPLPVCLFYRMDGWLV